MLVPTVLLCPGPAGPGAGGSVLLVQRSCSGAGPARAVAVAEVLALVSRRRWSPCSLVLLVKLVPVRRCGPGRLGGRIGATGRD